MALQISEQINSLVGLPKHLNPFSGASTPGRQSVPGPETGGLTMISLGTLVTSAANVTMGQLPMPFESRLVAFGWFAEDVAGTITDLDLNFAVRMGVSTGGTQTTALLSPIVDLTTYPDGIAYFQKTGPDGHQLLAVTGASNERRKSDPYVPQCVQTELAGILRTQTSGYAGSGNYVNLSCWVLVAPIDHVHGNKAIRNLTEPNTLLEGHVAIPPDIARAFD